MVRLGWARTYIKRQIARVKQVFKWAAAQELVPPAVYHGLVTVGGLRKGKSGAREAIPVKPVPEVSVLAVKPFVSRQVWAIVELQLLAGMRSGEVVIMRGCDLDTGGSAWTYRPYRHKIQHDGLTREVRIGPKARGIIHTLGTCSAPPTPKGSTRMLATRREVRQPTWATRSAPTAWSSPSSRRRTATPSLV